MPNQVWIISCYGLFLDPEAGQLVTNRTDKQLIGLREYFEAIASHILSQRNQGQQIQDVILCGGKTWKQHESEAERAKDPLIDLSESHTSKIHLLRYLLIHLGVQPSELSLNEEVLEKQLTAKVQEKYGQEVTPPSFTCLEDITKGWQHITQGFDTARQKQAEYIVFCCDDIRWFKIWIESWLVVAGQMERAVQAFPRLDEPGINYTDMLKSLVKDLTTPEFQKIITDHLRQSFQDKTELTTRLNQLQTECTALLTEQFRKVQDKTPELRKAVTEAKATLRKVVREIRQSPEKIKELKRKTFKRS
jgi:hypothetical protein